MVPTGRLSVVAFSGNGLLPFSPGEIDDQYEGGVGMTQASLFLKPDGQSWNAGRFTLTNNSRSTLVAFEITFRVSAQNGDVLEFSVREDGYLSEAPLAVGDSEQFHTWTSGSFQSPIDSVTATIAYLEFADHTYLGSEAKKIFSRLTAERSQAIGFAQSLKARLDRGVPVSEVLTSLSQNKAGPENTGVQTAKGLILARVSQNGVAALPAEVQRLARMTVTK